MKSPCPTDETLAQLASGDLDAETRLDVLAHIEHCSDCMAAVLSANAHLNEEQSAAVIPGPSRWWLAAAAAAAVIVAVLTLPMLRSRDPMGRLVALAPTSGRTVEPRLAGGFAWAPYGGPMRSTAGTADTARLKLQGAAGDAVERAERDRGPEAQHAAGVAMILMERPDEAAARLEAIVRTSHDARTRSDLAAARYAAAVQSGRTALLSSALAAANEALTADPRLPEALFNRALILERMGAIPAARQAWLHYLEVDGNSPWSAEARGRLKELSQ